MSQSSYIYPHMSDARFEVSFIFRFTVQSYQTFDDHSFQGYNSSSYLGLSYNQIIYLGNHTLASCYAVSRLILAHNQLSSLKQVDDALGSCKLEYLYLQGNVIGNISQTALKNMCGQSMSMLVLDDNSISALDISIFDCLEQGGRELTIMIKRNGLTHVMQTHSSLVTGLRLNNNPLLQITLQS